MTVTGSYALSSALGAVAWPVALAATGLRVPTAVLREGCSEVREQLKHLQHRRPRHRPGRHGPAARHAEDCSIELFYVSEHIVLYPGAKAGVVDFPHLSRGRRPAGMPGVRRGRYQRILP